MTDNPAATLSATASMALKSIAGATHRAAVAVTDVVNDITLTEAEIQAETTRILMQTDAVLREVIVLLESTGNAN